MLSKYSRCTRSLLQKHISKPVSRSMASVAFDHKHGEVADAEWSHTMSSASPNSDFCQSDRFSQPIQPRNHAAQHSLKDTIGWSESLSYVSPEADFTAQLVAESVSHPPSGPQWSESLSYASPEADFTFKEDSADDNKAQSQYDSFDHQMSLFSSPETALGVIHYGEMLEETRRNSTPSQYDSFISQLSLVSSPETAIGVIHYGEMLEGSHRNITPSQYDSFISQLSLFASPETAMGMIHYGEMLDDTLKSQLQEQQERQDALPHTISEALADSRPIVVTSTKSPFAIVDVNEAWVGLCGYTREEAINKKLGHLLQGPETNTRVASELVKRLQKDQYSEATLTNYSKKGDKIKNRVQVGVLSDDDGRVQYFVGVLNNIEKDNKASMG